MNIPPTRTDSPFRFAKFTLDFNKLVVQLGWVILTWRAFKLISYSAWRLDRGEFFNGGLVSPDILDMFFNEVILAYGITYILLFRFHLGFVLQAFLAGIFYFTRVPIILLGIAFLFCRFGSMRQKSAFLGLALLFSLAVLAYRVGSISVVGDHLYLFVGKYALVGVARLWVTDTVGLGEVSDLLLLLFRPLDSIFFASDFMGLSAGTSPGRIASFALNQFQYLPSLDGSFNAFGTILFPFVYNFGFSLGAVISCFALLINYLMLSLFLRFRGIGRLNRYMSFLILSGVLFSWCSPFIWVAPYLVIGFNRGRMVSNQRMGSVG